MQKSDEVTEKFKRYCNQLEKYGQTENVHSPVMAMLRRKYVLFCNKNLKYNSLSQKL